MADAAGRAYTLADYWAIESSSPIRHEYLHGAIYAMAGGTPRHNEIAANVLIASLPASRRTRRRTRPR